MDSPATSGALGPCARPEPRIWRRFPFAPDQSQLEELRALGVPRALLAHVADPHERPRVEHAGDALLLVLHYPSRPVHDAAVPFVTRPLSIILTPRTMSVPTLSWF